MDRINNFVNQLANQKPSTEGMGSAKEKLNKDMLEKMLVSYNADVLGRMLAGRGLPATKKKQEQVRLLAANFYNERDIKNALARLSKIGQEGLARLILKGGLMPLSAFNRTMNKRYSDKGADKALADIIGQALGLFAIFDGTILNFATYNNHSVTQPGFGYLMVNQTPVIWIPPQVSQLFTVPPDIARLVQPPLLQTYQGAEPEITNPARFDALMADIVTFLRYLEQNKVKLLQSGDVGKRDYTKISEQLTIKEAMPVAESRKISELGRTFFVWGILTGANLVEETADNLAVPHEQNLAKFYAMPRYEQARLLSLGWVNSHYNDFLRIPTLSFTSTSTNYADIPDEDELAQARNFIILLFQKAYEQKAMPEGWLDFKSFIAAIKETDSEFLIPTREMYNSYYSGYYSGPNYYNGYTSKLKPAPKNNKDYYAANPKKDEDWELVEGEWLAQILGEALRWLGITEVGLNKEKRPVAFRFTALGLSLWSGSHSAEEQAAAAQLKQLAETAPNMAKALIVQPNFDVMILAPLQNLPLMRQIDRFANQVSMGDVAMYRINKESVLRGFRGGLDGENIISLLNDNSRVPIAQNIQTSLQDWNAEFERLILRRNAIVLEMPDAPALDSIMNDPNLSKQIIKRISPTMALLNEYPGKLDKALQNPKTKQVALVLSATDLQRGAVSFKDPYLIEVSSTHFNPYLLYRLGQFADLESWDINKRTAVFRLTASSVTRGKEQGLNAYNIFNTLQERIAAKAKLDPETMLAINGWLGIYGAVSGEKAVALQAHHSVLDDVFSVAKFRQALISRPTPGVALVRESEYTRLQTDLAQLGITLQEPTVMQASPMSPPPALPSQTKDSNKLASLPTPFPKRGKALEGTVVFDDGDFDDDGKDFVDDEYDDEFGEDAFKVLQKGISDLLFSDAVFGELMGGKKGTKNVPPALRELAALDPEERKAMLLEAGVDGLYDPHPQERQAAIEILNVLGTPAARRMTELLYDPDPNVRYNACVVIGNTGDAESLQHLQVVISDKAKTRIGKTVGEGAKMAIQSIARRLKR